ncbi:ABATE domain-containing protein [bacterium]|nr:ABATE domain-containing protein [bacterium]
MAWNSDLETHLELTSGWLCLDFANTMDMHAAEEPQETLHDYKDLVAWAETRGVLSPGEAEGLRKQGKREPGQAEHVLQESIGLREALYQIFSAVAAGGSAQPQNLEQLNKALKHASPNMSLVPKDRGFTWAWEGAQPSLGSILWPISQSAAELLTLGDLTRIGECAAEDGCGWLFFDTTKNHSRRWCDMRDCGNRDKVRRYYKRQTAKLS